LVEFNIIMLKLTAALGLSVVVERVTGFLTNIFSYFPINETLPAPIEKSAKQKEINNLKAITESGLTAEQQEAAAEALAKQLDEAIRNNNTAEAEKLRTELAGYTRDREWNEAVPSHIIAWQPATAPNDSRVYREVALHAVGLLLGIGLAAYSDLQLFHVLLGTSSVIHFSASLDYIFTGLLISAGSGPVNVLITFISQRKVSVATDEIKAGEDKQEKQKTARIESTGNHDKPALQKAMHDADWVHIPYQGGVDRDSLEFVHKRKADPDMVIFHHTAMRRDAAFDDVVRVIKSRKDSKGNPWLTGYNCVITEDGVIHPFCRWDRYGSHAAGYNSRSLGLAFNGNFETNRDVPYANHDGRYGPSTPSDPQLESGARIVALWAHIYPGISPTFGAGGSIIPHNLISDKGCPGSAFPYQDFYDLVLYYYKAWENSDTAKGEIKKFMRRPYLYTGGDNK